MKEFKEDLKIVVKKIFAEIDNNNKKFNELEKENRVSFALTNSYKYSDNFMRAEREKSIAANNKLLNLEYLIESNKLLQKYEKEVKPDQKTIDSIEYQLQLSNIFKLLEMSEGQVNKDIFKHIIAVKDINTINALNKAYNLKLIEPIKDFNNKCEELVRNLQELMQNAEDPNLKIFNRDMVFVTLDNSYKNVDITNVDDTVIAAVTGELV